MGLSDIKLTDIDFVSVEACTQPRVLRRYIKLLEEDGGYFHQLLHAAREKLASLIGYKPSSLAKGIGGGASAAEIAAARQDLLLWQYSLKSSSLFTSDNEAQKKKSGESVKSINDATQELEDVAPDVEEDAHANGNLTDEKEIAGNRGAKNCPPSQAEQGEATQETGNSGKKENDEEVGSDYDEAKEKRGKEPGEHKIASGDIREQSKEERNVEGVDKVNNHSGGQKVNTGTGSQCPAECDTKLAETRFVQEETLSLVSNTTKVENRIKLPSTDEGEGRPFTAGKHGCLPIRKRASHLEYDESVEGQPFVGSSTSEQEIRERRTVVNASQCARESSHLRSVKRQMQKICVQVEDEDDTEDECSDTSSSEDD